MDRVVNLSTRNRVKSTPYIPYKYEGYKLNKKKALDKKVQQCNRSVDMELLLSQSLARIFLGWTPSLSSKDRTVYVLVWLLGLCPLEPLHISCIHLGDMSPLPLTFLISTVSILKRSWQDSG
jgi:hypothetical protein